MQRGPFSEPSQVLDDEGLYEFCLKGALFLPVAADITQAQQTLRRGLILAGHGSGIAWRVARPLGMASDNLIDAQRMMARTWRVATKLIPELNGSADGPQAGAFKVKTKNTRGGQRR